MAEIKTGIFAKNVQKRLSRAQEKVLQKLGKADETKDEQFEQCVLNFKRQESEGSRLQREMKAYQAAVKAMQQASMNLTESLHEVYEPDWHGKDDVLAIGKNCDALWEDFHERLVDSSLNTMEAYLLQFPDLKNRVAKRSRKLIDYDSARHHMETLQTSGMRNDRKVMKAEEELKKAQKVFDELNIGLQDELPTLWDSRVSFYVSTFKNVTHLEAKFHREISLLCKQLYEVMTKLAEQHKDKIFTIQGAPSDSGPLRLARTPSPPDDDSPPESPVAASNHMLRPVSPGPPRPKSPSQPRKGPPVPPPPKVTPTKELHQEQIINLFGDFGDEFLPPPATTPCLPNERPGESLLDMDFDAFIPECSTSMGHGVSPMPQTLPWDMWTANSEPVQTVTNAFNGFSQDGSAPAFFADFDKMNETGATASSETGATASSETEATASSEAGEATASSEAGEATASSEAGEATASSEAGEATVSSEAGEATASSEAVATSSSETEATASSEAAANASSEAVATSSSETEATASSETEANASSDAVANASSEAGETTETRATASSEACGPTASPEAEDTTIAHKQETAPDMEDNYEKIQESAPPVGETGAAESATSPKDEKPASTVGSPVESAATEAAEPPEIGPTVEAATESSYGAAATLPAADETPAAAATIEATSQAAPKEEKMPIPSVVIEPASSNEGDDDRDGDIISPTTTISDNGVTPDSQAAGLPDGFMYRVETLHDFEAANSDELDLKKGDIVLVIPTILVEDQEAGWLTGFKESEWCQLGAHAHKGLFPENFIQRLD